MKPMYIQELREMVSPPSQNTVGICNQITLRILYYISSRLVTLLKVTDITIPISDIFDLTVSFSFIKFNFKIFLLFSAVFTSFTSSIVYASTLLWFGSCNNCILACFLWSKTVNIHQTMEFAALIHAGLRLYLTEVLIFSLFSLALFVSSLSLKFSKAANLFEILIWYWFLTSSSFSFLRLNPSA
jgi:hypothetical protein